MPIVTDFPNTLLKSVEENHEENSSKYPSPIIFKITSKLDRYLITSHFKNLSDFNSNRDMRVFVTDHLSKKMQLERKSLMLLFIEARRNKSKTNWRVDFKRGAYCLLVNNVVHFAQM